MKDKNGKEIQEGQRVGYKTHRGPSSIGRVRKKNGTLFVGGRSVKDILSHGGDIWIIPSVRWVPEN